MVLEEVGLGRRIVLTVKVMYIPLQSGVGIGVVVIFMQARAILWPVVCRPVEFVVTVEDTIVSCVSFPLLYIYFTPNYMSNWRRRAEFKHYVCRQGVPVDAPQLTDRNIGSNNWMGRWEMYQ